MPKKPKSGRRQGKSKPLSFITDPKTGERVYLRQNPRQITTNTREGPKDKRRQGERRRKQIGSVKEGELRLLPKEYPSSWHRNKLGRPSALSFGYSGFALEDRRKEIRRKAEKEAHASLTKKLAKMKRGQKRQPPKK